jgi:hypothetical protein
MAQTKAGALKAAAKKAGLSIDEYKSNIESGLKRCTQCKTWKTTDSFGSDRTRSDGKDSTCLDCRRVDDPYASLRGRISTFKGRIHTEEAKQKMSEAKKGKKFRLGKNHSLETRARISKIGRERTQRGADHYNFKHGQAQRNLDDRRRPEYSDWRNAVFARDNYTCQKCGDNKGGNLRAHHIKPFSKYAELRFDISNGITLCHTCHELEHLKPDSIRKQRKPKRGEKLWS